MPPTMGRRVNLLILRRQSRCAGQDMSDHRTGPDSNAARCRMGGLNEKGNSADLPKQGASLRPTRRAHPTTKGHGTPEGKPARTVARVGATIRHGLVFSDKLLPGATMDTAGWGFQGFLLRSLAWADGAFRPSPGRVCATATCVRVCRFRQRPLTKPDWRWRRTRRNNRGTTYTTIFNTKPSPV